MEPEKQSDLYGRLFEVAKKSLPVFALILGIIVLFGLILYLFAIPFDVYLIWKIYDYVVFKIVDISGFNQWLVKGIVIIALIPLLWVLPRVYRGKYKKAARAAGLFYVGLFFLTLFFLSKDAYFTREGRPAKFYIVTSSGVKYVDSEDIDRTTGRKPQPVTPEILEKLKRWEKGIIDFRRVDPTATPWFNPLTGKAEIWCYRYPDGTFEFYNKDGFHPLTGEPLKAVTNQILAEWKGQVKEDEKKRGGQQIALIKQRELEENEKKLQEFKSFINKDILTYPQKLNIAFIIESQSIELPTSLENLFISNLKRDNINVIDHYFKEDFKKTKYFEEIYGGNTEILRQTDALSKLDYLIMGKISYSFRKESQVEKDMVSCNINFFYKTINKKGDIVKSDRLNAIGVGFSEDAAIERGLEILSEKYSGRIFNLL